ncbi:MAG: winged helix-turn-helix domain-containing protein, partial [Rhizomicrobium sp.]
FRPALRQVQAAGRRESVEPRVMQVLVALMRSRGVVSRDQLIDLCWGGRLVGDDAINSCMAKVRGLAALSSPPAFEIETVPRVGYRLIRARAEKRAAVAAESPAPASPAAKPVPVLFGHRWLFAGAVAALLSAAAAATVFFWPKPAGEWQVVESHQPFIGTSLIERYPAISPDGTMLAYSAGPNLTSRQIYLRLFKADSSLQLTHGAFDATSPAWSADGTTIAYSVFQSGWPCRIMEMEIPSGEPHQIAGCHSAERAELSFDPSGRALVFGDSNANDAPTHIVKFDIENGKSTPITDPPRATLGDDLPRFSPDGRYLIYVRELGGDARSELRLRRMSNGYERVVDKFHGCDVYPAWTPDGTAILASRSCQGSYSLRAYPLQGAAARDVFYGASGIGRLSVNANGTVAMETSGGRAPILAFKPDSTLPPIPLANGSGLTSYCADFASDGTLAVTGSVEGKFGVWLADQEGAPFRKLMSLSQFACAIRWSPDGTRFAFIETNPSGGFAIPIVRRDGEVLARLAYAGSDSNMFDWTADGKSILTSRLDKQGWRIWRTDLVTPGRSVPVSPPGWIDPRVHGTMLFAEKYGAVGTWRLDTGTPQRVADGPTQESSDILKISGDRLYFADLTDPQHPAIAVQSVYGGAKKCLMPIPFGAVDFTFAVNPKSGDIVFSPPPADDNDIGLLRLRRR